MPRRFTAPQGFTLIELSIVMLVIALIIAGIASARSLLATSRTHTTISEAQKYLQAIQMFKAKYNALPGDFTGATARWAGTADGNGDGIIATATEGLRAWQHMSLANVTPQNLTGTGALALGTNLPKSHAYDGAGFQIAGSVSVFTVNRGNVLLFGKLQTTDLTYGVMIARDAAAIDEKIDDKRPDNGMVLGVSGQENGTAKCTDKLWNAAAPAAYNFNDTTGLCYLVFLFAGTKF